MNPSNLWILISLFFLIANRGYTQTEHGRLLGDTAYYTQINSLLRKGDDLNKAELFDSASRFYHQSLILSQQNQYQHGTMEALIGMGVTNTNMGYYEKGMHFYKEALAYSDTSKELQDLLPALYNGIAGTYHYWEQYEKAVQYQLKAITIRQKYSSGLSLPLLYHNISVTLLKMGRKKEALYYLHKGEILARGMERKEMLIQILLQLSTVYNYEKDYKKSKHYLQSALKISETYDNKAVQQSIYMNLAIQALSNKEVHNSTFYAKLALKRDAGQNVKAQLIIMKLLGTAYLQLKDYSAAQYWLNRSLTIARLLNNIQFMGDLHRLLANVHFQKNNIDSVYQHQNKALALADSLKFKEQTETAMRMEFQYRTAQKDKEIAESQLLINRQKSAIYTRNIWIGITIAGLLASMLFVVLLYKGFRQKQILKEERLQHLLRTQELKEAKAIMNAEEQERSRIARDLHDSIMIQFSTIKMNLSTLIGKGDTIIKKESIEPYIIQLDKATQSLRKTAHHLMPDMLLEGGLVEAIYYFCNSLQKDVLFEITCEQLGIIPRFDTQYELAIYRIFQELIQNIIKHAQASEVYIQLSYSNCQLGIEIEDNGIGFQDKKSNKEYKGIGLKSIEARLLPLQGNMDIATGKSGTNISLEFNIKPVSSS